MPTTATAIPDFLPTAPVPCRTNPALFDAPTSGAEATGAPYQRRKELAATICATCPVRAACDAHASTHGELGIWAGLDDADRGTHHHLPTPKTETHHPRTTHECGTEPAIRAHWSRREHCTPCETAHQERTRTKQVAALDREHAAGGSRYGYQLHRKLGIPRDNCGCTATKRTTRQPSTSPWRDDPAVYRPSRAA